MRPPKPNPMAAPWVEDSLIALVASSSATFVFVQRSSAAGGEGDGGAVFVSGAQQFGVAVAADAADREGGGDHQGDASQRRQPRRHVPASLPLQNLRLVAQPRQPLSWNRTGAAPRGPYATAH